MKNRMYSLLVTVAICSAAWSPVFAAETRFEHFASSLRHDTLYQADESTRAALDSLIKSGKLKKMLSSWDKSSTKASRSYTPKPYVAENAFRQFERFFEKFKMAVFVAEAETVADMAHFPLAGSDVFGGSDADPRAAFIRSFDRIFDPFTRAVLYNKQAKDAHLNYENHTFKYSVSVLHGSVDPDSGEVYESSIIYQFERREGEFKFVGLMIAG